MWWEKGISQTKEKISHFTVKQKHFYLLSSFSVLLFTFFRVVTLRSLLSKVEKIRKKKLSNVDKSVKKFFFPRNSWLQFCIRTAQFCLSSCVSKNSRQVEECQLFVKIWNPPKKQKIWTPKKKVNEAVLWCT